MALYDSILLKLDHPASSTLFAILVLAIFDGLTSPITISPCSLAIFADALCRKSLRRFAIFT
jgi:hypothetical protein